MKKFFSKEKENVCSVWPECNEIYKIISEDQDEKSIVINPEMLSRSVNIGAEVYDVSDKEIFLGALTRRSLVYISTEIIDYAMNNYVNKRIEDVDDALFECRRWLDDPNSLKEYPVWNLNYDKILRAGTVVYSLHQAASSTINSIFSDSKYFHSAMSQVAVAAHLIGVGYDHEYMRQSRFIIDFMKSDKFLFMV